MHNTSIGIYLTPRSIYWRALKRSASGPSLLDIDVENPLRTPIAEGLCDGAGVTAIKEKIKTIIAGTKDNAAVVIHQPNVGLVGGKDGLQMGCLLTLAVVAAHEMKVPCFTKTPAQCNGLIRPGTHHGGKSKGQLEAFVSARLPSLDEQELKCVICAWAGLES